MTYQISDIVFWATPTTAGEHTFIGQRRNHYALATTPEGVFTGKATRLVVVAATELATSGASGLIDTPRLPSHN